MEDVPAAAGHDLHLVAAGKLLLLAASRASGGAIGGTAAQRSPSQLRPWGCIPACLHALQRSLTMHTGQRTPAPPRSSRRSAVRLSMGSAATTFFDAGGGARCTSWPLSSII